MGDTEGNGLGCPNYFFETWRDGSGPVLSDQTGGLRNFNSEGDGYGGDWALPDDGQHKGCGRFD